jgi:hypothetical protein
MKVLVSILVCIFSFSAFAQNIQSTEIKPVSQDGKPRIGVQFASDFLALTASVYSNDLISGRGARVYANFVKKSSETPYSDLIWQSNIAPQTPAGTTYVVRMGLKGAAAQAVVSKLSAMIVELTVLSDDGLQKSVFIDLGSLCTTNPGSFLNLDTSTSGCP